MGEALKNSIFRQEKWLIIETLRSLWTLSRNKLPIFLRKRARSLRQAQGKPSVAGERSLRMTGYYHFVLIEQHRSYAVELLRVTFSDLWVITRQRALSAKDAKEREKSKSKAKTSSPQTLRTRSFIRFSQRIAYLRGEKVLIHD